MVVAGLLVLLGAACLATSRRFGAAIGGEGIVGLLGGGAIIVGLLLAIDSERRAERRARSLEAVLGALRQGIAVFDARDRLVEWNGRFAELLGTQLDLRRGVTTKSDLSRDLAARAGGAPALFAGPVPSVLEIASGPRRLEVDARALAAGGSVYALHDVTERRASEEVALHSPRLEAVGKVTGGIAHDFNNLLTAIIGHLDLAAPDVADRPDATRMLRRAITAATGGQKLVGQLLLFGRARSVDSAALDPRALITRMTDVIRTTLGSKSNLVLELEPGRERCLIDGSQLELGLLNLVLNARDAMPNGGTLRISLSTTEIGDEAERPHGLGTGKYVKITVRDSGTGMPPEVAARAFEPFFTTKPAGEASGLGLSQTYGIARQANGTVNLSSRPGEGTSVSMLLPAADAAAEAPVDAAAAVPILPDASPLHGRRVLVVEDDDLVRGFVAAALRRIGLEVAEAENADAAIEELHRCGRVDVLCTDIMMPGSMTGFELAQKARAAQPDLKIVFMSGFHDKALERIRPANGSVPHLKKPFRAADLVASVRRVIDEAAVSPANDRAVTVVVVDDDDDVRAAATDALRRAGYIVIGAGSGAEALAALDANPSTRLLFTDIKMPGIDGFMLADMAKMRWPKLKVLYATGYHDEVQTKPGIRHGEILAKPYRAAQLTEGVRRALG